MKNWKHGILTGLIFMLFITTNVFSQGKHGGGHGNKKEGNGNGNANRGQQGKHVRNRTSYGSGNGYQKNKRYYRKSSYRPKYFHNYRPIWAHHQNYNRRWIYFPQQNFYYDNWRQVYFFKSNNIWRMNVSLPASFIRVNLEDQRHYELTDEDDEMDRIYIDNNKHFTLFDLNIIVK